MHDLAEGATSVMKTLVMWQMGLSAAKSANLRPRIQIPLGAHASRDAGEGSWSAAFGSAGDRYGTVPNRSHRTA